jgi:sugar lactone lactonase YvrE
MATENTLGEGARYDRALDVIDWVDIPACEIHSYSPAAGHTATVVDIEPGFAVRTASGDRLAGGSDGFVSVSDESSRRAYIPGVGSDCAINDGAVHPTGTCLVFGSRHREETRPLGRAYLLGKSLIALPWCFTVFNGPAFSLDGRTIYFADSPEGLIWSAPFDATRSTVGERSIFSTVPAEDGFPDGMAVDSDGHLWSAHWDGWRITRYRPDGQVDRVVEVPMARPTSVAFAGPDGSQLIFTSARTDTAPDTRSQAEGALLALDLGVSGPASPRLSGAFDLDQALTQVDHAEFPT